MYLTGALPVNTKALIELARLSTPIGLQSAQRSLANARETAAEFALSSPDDMEMAVALHGVAEAIAAVEAIVRQRVNARVQLRSEREAELKANPFRFVINHADGTQTKGGARTKNLALFHLHKVARENPGATCFYTGRDGAIERPVRVR